jgi:hypothetical protein
LDGIAKESSTACWTHSSDGTADDSLDFDGIDDGSLVSARDPTLLLVTLLTHYSFRLII